ncbi:hypothetical protein AVEN_90618-1 [Araneus ventricosus]|uniref:Uncharacterized protein n=1 Tax=Araneus ventricosus TaxID=182803 RepID=A0A4Y2N1G9_ARAVE|nr:hypothetical protein AVEN_90618-1 [Araneus ventricosus]
MGRSVPGSKPDSTEDLSRIGPVVVDQKSSRWCGAEILMGMPFRCRLRHLTAVQKYEIRSKIALALLQNGTLNGREFRTKLKLTT